MRSCYPCALQTGPVYQPDLRRLKRRIKDIVNRNIARGETSKEGSTHPLLQVCHYLAVNMANLQLIRTHAQTGSCP